MINLRSVTVSFHDRVILNNILLTVNQKEKVGIVGANGVGKSTLLKLVKGEIEPNKGAVSTEGSVAYVPQDFSINPKLYVEEYIKRHIGIYEIESTILDAEKAYVDGNEPSDLQKYLDSIELYRQRGGYEFDAQLSKLMNRVGLPERLKLLKLSQLSGGQQIKIGLLAVLLSKHDVYLLDEPTNNLDIKGIELLEEFVKESSASFMIVSHDRRFLDKTITGILEIDEFSHKGIYYGVDFSEYQILRHLDKEAAEKRYEEYLSEKKRLETSATTKAQQAGQGKVTRNDNDKLGANHRGGRAASSQAGQARQIRRRLNQLGEIEQPPDKWELMLNLEVADPSGDIVCTFKDAKVKLGDFEFGPTSLEITREDRVAIIGVNGAGKSTLLKLMTAELKPDEGEVNIGPSVSFGRLDQDHRLIERGISVFDNAQKNIKGMPVSEIRSLLSKFNLKADIIDRNASSISPGERARLQLAIIMANGANTLLLDEPTNHLDLEAQEQLEIALQAFNGTLLLVSHDREFIKNIGVNRIIEVTEGKVSENWDLIRLVE